MIINLVIFSLIFVFVPQPTEAYLDPQSVNQAEVIYPLNSQDVLQSLIREFNIQQIKMADWYYDEDINPAADKTFEIITGVNKNGEFFIEGANGGFKLFKVDINNDGEEEFVKTLESGSGRFFDIEAVYKKVNGGYVDINDEIKLPIRKLIRDTKNETYDLEEGYVGFAFGDIIVEKKDGKIYFTLLQGRTSRPWEDLNSFNVSETAEAYEFLWSGKDLTLNRVYDRKLRKEDFFATE